MEKVKNVEIIFENLESIIVPWSNFEYFDVGVNLDSIKDKKYTAKILRMKINDSDKIEWGLGFRNDLRPFERFNYSRDICYLYLKDENNNILKTISVEWSDNNPNNNTFQKNNKIDYKTIAISIEPNKKGVYYYPAFFTKEEDGQICVEFPDLKGCLACGYDEQDALNQAQECLEGWIQFSTLDTIPEPSSIFDYVGVKGVESVQLIKAVLS